jgi:hypothetical protein
MSPTKKSMSPTKRSVSASTLTPTSSKSPTSTKKAVHYFKEEPESETPRIHSSAKKVQQSVVQQENTIDDVTSSISVMIL